MQDTSIKNNSKLTYKAPISAEERNNVIKSFLLPLLVFALVIFTIIFLGNFGRIIVTPFSCMIWVSGLIVSFLLPSFRESINKEVTIELIIYCGTLIFFKFIIMMVSGVNSATIGSSLNTAMPETSGNAILGWLQNIFFFGAIFTPIGFIGHQVQRAVKFKRNNNISKEMDKQRGIRDTNGNFQ